MIRRIIGLAMLLSLVVVTFIFTLSDNVVAGVVRDLLIGLGVCAAIAAWICIALGLVSRGKR